MVTFRLNHLSRRLLIDKLLRPDNARSICLIWCADFCWCFNGASGLAYLPLSADWGVNTSVTRYRTSKWKWFDLMITEHEPLSWRIICDVSHKTLPRLTVAQISIEAAILVRPIRHVIWNRNPWKIAYLTIAIDKNSWAKRETEAWGWLMETIKKHPESS